MSTIHFWIESIFLHWHQSIVCVLSLLSVLLFLGPVLLPALFAPSAHLAPFVFFVPSAPFPLSVSIAFLICLPSTRFVFLVFLVFPFPFVSLVFPVFLVFPVSLVSLVSPVSLV